MYTARMAAPQQLGSNMSEQQIVELLVTALEVAGCWPGAEGLQSEGSWRVP